MTENQDHVLYKGIDMKDGYTNIRNSFLLDAFQSKFSSSAIKLYLYLAMRDFHKGKKSLVFPSYETIKTEANLSDVRGAIVELVENGWLGYKSTGFDKNNNYQIKYAKEISQEDIDFCSRRNWVKKKESIDKSKNNKQTSGKNRLSPVEKIHSKNQNIKNQKNITLSKTDNVTISLDDILVIFKNEKKSKNIFLFIKIFKNQHLLPRLGQNTKIARWSKDIGNLFLLIDNWIQNINENLYVGKLTEKEIELLKIKVLKKTYSLALENDRFFDYPIFYKDYLITAEGLITKEEQYKIQEYLRKKREEENLGKEIEETPFR